jgi:hypothetical protein
LQNHPQLALATSAFGDYIKAEVLGDSITFADKVDGVELSFDEVESILKVEKA